MLNGMFVVVGIDDGVAVVVVVVVEKQSPGISPNFAIQTLTDQNNIDVVGMTVKGQMKK